MFYMNYDIHYYFLFLRASYSYSYCYQGVIIIHTNTEHSISKSKAEEATLELQALNITISHEIKAPVRAIDGYARIFIEDFGSQVNEEGVELIQNIRTICSDTLTLINKLLDYTKYADFEPIQEALNLKAIIQQVFSELTLGYTHKQRVHLEIEETIPYLLADGVLIRQVLVNLLSNSLKFTKSKGDIRIKAGYFLENQEHIFYIKDNGVGFDMNFSENLFGMFQRMHSIDDFEGSGVGLAIVKKIIQKFGGRVWLTGEVGKGACAYFSIAADHILT